jgi:Rieske Fe-S protein
VGVPPTSRRRFLNVLLGASALGWLGSLIYPAIRFLMPLPPAGAGGPTPLSADELQRLDREKFVIVRSGPARVIVFEAPGARVRALDAKCTHEGCTVKYIPEEAFISCACHNGRFDLDGRVLAGPPPRPLPQYDVARGNDGGVVVTARRA